MATFWAWNTIRAKFQRISVRVAHYRRWGRNAISLTITQVAEVATETFDAFVSSLVATKFDSWAWRQCFTCGRSKACRNRAKGSASVGQPVAFPIRGRVAVKRHLGWGFAKRISFAFCLRGNVPEPPDLAKKYSVYVMKDGKRKLISLEIRDTRNSKTKVPACIRISTTTILKKRGFIMRGTVERKIALQQNIGRIGLCGDYSTSSSR